MNHFPIGFIIGRLPIIGGVPGTETGDSVVWKEMILNSIINHYTDTNSTDLIQKFSGEFYYNS